MELMYSTDKLSAVEAQKKALNITFGPMIFQAVRVMLNKGILDFVRKSGKKGTSPKAVSEKLDISFYGARVLMQSGLGAGVFYLNDGCYALSKTGYFLINSAMPKVNIDFVHDVCYKGMFFLEESIETQKPAGLKVFGEWPTIYRGLSSLPEDVQKSWFKFDHYFSDLSFPETIKIVAENNPRTILDIGGNTGKFCGVALEFLPRMQFTIADLPEQIVLAKKELSEEGADMERVNFQGINILDEEQALEGKFDVIWMSQFLDCFPDESIVKILKRVKNHLNDRGSVFIQEEFWDRQRFEAGAAVLQQLSLYFTAMANGTSQMYDFATFSKLIEAAGFEIKEIHDNQGNYVSLLELIPKP